MIRAKEVVLTPAPGWNEAEGRPIQRGEDDIAEVEVEFKGRPTTTEVVNVEDEGHA